MNTNEKQVLESFLRLIRKSKESALNCLKNIEKENSDIALEYQLELIDSICTSLITYLDDINCY